jgi:hypothetical protein
MRYDNANCAARQPGVKIKMSARVGDLRPLARTRIPRAADKGKTMRYLYLVSGREGGPPPPQAMIDAVEKQAEIETAAGRMISRGGLFPTSMGGARFETRRGKVKVIDGPFAETKEVIGGFAIFEYATPEEAHAGALQLMELHRVHWPDWEGVCEMRPSFPDDAPSGM